MVFGIWGIAVLAPILSRSVYPWLEDNLGFLPFFAGPASTSGRTMMTAAVVLAVMILPIITAISREVFLQTPRLHEEASLALGATKWEMIRQAVLPYGRSGVISGAMLGLGRALGETMAVAIILSPADLITVNVISNQNPNTIASNIALKFPESSGLEVNRLIATGLVLFVVTFLVNCAGPPDRQRRILGSGRMTLTEERPAPVDARSRRSLPIGSAVARHLAVMVARSRSARCRGLPRDSRTGLAGSSCRWSRTASASMSCHASSRGAARRSTG